MNEIDVKNASRTELAEIMARIRARERELREQDSDDSEPVAYALTLNAGNKTAGAKSWVRTVDAVDGSKTDTGFGFVGEWQGETGALPSGTLLLVGGRGGTHDKSTSHSALLRVKAGATFTSRAGYQSFEGSGVELLAEGAKLPVEKVQAIVSRYPDLAPAAKGYYLPLYFAAMEAIEA